jgi:TPP-dependent pyruvate/acetoin dehydrogenase alpha subunit
MGQVHGTTHLCIGEEGSCVGSIAALEPEVIVVGNTGPRRLHREGPWT